MYDVTKRKNITHDQYKSNQETINDICNDIAIDTSTFTTQGLVIKAISDYADKKYTTTQPLYATNEHIFIFHLLLK